ncbi:unnamed protein product, partial [Symbiodinium sp. CCMP2456]
MVQGIGGMGQMHGMRQPIGQMGEMGMGQMQQPRGGCMGQMEMGGMGGGCMGMDGMAGQMCMGGMGGMGAMGIDMGRGMDGGLQTGIVEPNPTLRSNLRVRPDCSAPSLDGHDEAAAG